MKREYNDAFENQEPLQNENILAGNIPGQKKAVETVEKETKVPEQKTEVVETKVADTKKEEDLKR